MLVPLQSVQLEITIYLEQDPVIHLVLCGKLQGVKVSNRETRSNGTVITVNDPQVADIGWVVFWLLNQELAHRLGGNLFRNPERKKIIK